MGDKLVFSCPILHKNFIADCGWGSHSNDWKGRGKPLDYPELPPSALIRRCNACGFYWPDCDDWKYFRRAYSTKEAYDAAWKEVYTSESCSEQSPWERLLAR